MSTRITHDRNKNQFHFLNILFLSSTKTFSMSPNKLSSITVTFKLSTANQNDVTPQVRLDFNNLKH